MYKFRCKRKIDVHNISEYMQRKVAEGWKVLNDSGSYGIIFHHPNFKYIIKIGEVIGNIVSKDPYLSFIKKARLCNSHWFPVFHDIIIIDPVDRQKFFVVVMERLAPMTRHTRVMYEAFCEQVYKWNDESLRHHRHFYSDEFHKVALVLTKLFRKFDEDLHDENVMFRGKQLVIIDPVC